MTASLVPVDADLFNTEAFDTALQETDSPLPLFRDALQSAHEELARRFYAGRAATELVTSRAGLIDTLLQRAWTLYFEPGDPGIALLAVGGYGRGELHPASDVDLMLLLTEAPEPYHTAIEGFLTFLWDMGLEVGQSVRTLDECQQEAARDITVATNLQEARLLIGPSALFEQQKALCGPQQIWPSREFFEAKLREQEQRHDKFNDTAYNLEPNIKEGPGGLRDIQIIGWVAKRHYNAGSLSQLVDHGFLTVNEYRTLHEGQAFLWQVRFGLHLIAGRREDRLLFDHQRELARHFGYRDNFKGLAVEQFMKQYYRTIMELSRLNEMLLQLFKEEILLAEEQAEPVSLNRRFQARKGYLEVKEENVFVQYPFALLEIFLLLMQHPELKGVRANTIRLIRDHTYLIDTEFRADLRNRSLFMEILRYGHGFTHALRRMYLYGVLAAYLPVFGRIVGQMQHDLFHVYTVDEHTVMVIRNLRRFTVPEYFHEFPLCSEIMQRIPKQELLLLAALFHDVAKGRGGDHSTLGAADAREFCKNHGLSNYDTKLVVWLVKNHLLMSSTAQRKDISDPDIVHEFAEQVGDLVHLNYLYLLTVADIRGTSEHVWNSWKDALLQELYHATVRALRRGLKNPLVQSELVRERRQAAAELLESDDEHNVLINQLWDNLGDEYFLRYFPDEIVWHTQAILNTDLEDLPVILFREQSRRGGTEIFIYTRDHPNLFALITSVLSQAGMTVVDARILASRDGYTLDTFQFLDSSGEPVRDNQRNSEIRNKLYHLLRHPGQEAPEITRRLPRQAKHFKIPTEIHFEDDSERTIMQVKTYDRPGLLSNIGSVFYTHDIQLHNAKIATFGERVEDIFEITSSDDRPLNAEQKETLRLSTLEELEE
ncbi:[protein-PII] uridylyltransferase [Thiohalophilus thiocyanatoxydans]|uniref:Bifunctional uridylyltransferase/uridylyl-removing enzyme n=1 Tax=Thiohalophilus thiocyanatoxydans TaxID=381308 RepID=A0A4R8IHN3_9GAMM|nr:[protein-PII] uridylyltransferase [Thiohalophilus thiocyanatoxydans]TDY00111.1 UTP--GlnB (protein PII) uridylyltransferase GlnD [Thiohalophilus thiocyanatoxydans]